LILGYLGATSTLPEVEVDKIKVAMRPLRELFGDTLAAEFGPVRFKAVRQMLVDLGLTISTIRARLGVIKRMIAWGVENEMLPGDALHRLQAVAPLKAGRDGVKPSRKVKPVPEADIRAILPHLNPTVRAMVELQALTGARPGEIWRMTTGQIDRAGNLWLYSPTSHKTSHHGKDRIIPLGPRAQEALAPWLKADPKKPLFSPIEATEAQYARRRATRKTPHTPSSRARIRKRDPKRKPREYYDKNSYKQAIERACLRAGVPVFKPNQIRHSYATRVRREYGLEAAQVLLGHSKADVTQVYAERDLALASDIAAKIG
jgi:integrase